MKSIKINNCVSKMRENYIFVQIEKKKAEYAAAHPENKLIDLGIGDVSGPLPAAAVRALVIACKAQGNCKTFRGYGPESGYEFCKSAIANYYKRSSGADIKQSEIFVGDGAKSAIMRLFAAVDCEIVVFSPAYPAYEECALSLNKKVKKIERSALDGFIPLPYGLMNKPRLIVLCSPDNPTGTAIGRDIMAEWLSFCKKSGSVIMFDSAYERFCFSPDKVRSVYETEGMRDYAVEIGSLSKSACFTGLRAGWTIIPETVAGGRLKKTYERMLSCGYNGLAYVVQQACAAALSEDGERESAAFAGKIIAAAEKLAGPLETFGFKVFGGAYSPYLWVQKPDFMKKIDAFDFFLDRLGILITPGSGFGEKSEDFFRLSALGGEEKAEEAAKRIKDYFVQAKL